MLECPYPSAWTVRRARDAYLEENGFTVASYADKWTGATVFGIPIKVPNTPRHAWAIMLHDLHHVATGYGTDMRGEGEISIWEARRGLKPLGLYVASIIVFGSLGGVLMAPRRALAAWRAAASRTPSLFAGGDTDADYEALLALTVGELRTLLSVPHEGLVTSRALHAQAPKRIAEESNGLPESSSVSLQDH